MPSETLIPESNLLGEPTELLGWTMVCRKGWEEYSQRKRNGLTEYVKQQLLHEYFAMGKVIHHLIPEEPVRVENYAIVYDQTKMELKKISPIEIHGRLYLVRKMRENVVDTIELEPVEE